MQTTTIAFIMLFLYFCLVMYLNYVHPNLCVLKLTLNSGNWTEKLNSNNINFMCRKWDGHSNEKMVKRKHFPHIFAISSHLFEKSNKCGCGFDCEISLLNVFMCVAGEKVRFQWMIFHMCKTVESFSQLSNGAFNIKRTFSINRN